MSGSVVTYIPNADYNGDDSFTFKANDGKVDSNPRTVSISVAAVNDAPVFTVMGPCCKWLGPLCYVVLLALPEPKTGVAVCPSKAQGRLLGASLLRMQEQSNNS